MAEMNATPEEQVARVTVSAEAGFLQPVIEFVGRMTDRLGLVDAGRMEAAVEMVCMNVIEHAFGPEEEGSLVVYVLRGAGPSTTAACKAARTVRCWRRCTDSSTRSAS